MACNHGVVEGSVIQLVNVSVHRACLEHARSVPGACTERARSMNRAYTDQARVGS